jgi:hypothetical protein
VLRGVHAHDTWKTDLKASLRGIARALHSFMGNVSEERLPEKLATLSERLTTSSDQDQPSEPGIGRVQMSQGSAKSAVELESMIMAELREHPECESAAVVIIGPTGAGWDATLAGPGATLNVECQERLAAITNRLRQQFD